MKNIVSWSGGKDSTATVILAHENGIPIEKIVMVALWFDRERGIPATLPHHWEFITKVAVPRFKEWGYDTEFIFPAMDYIHNFYHVIKKSKYPERIGKRSGFLIPGKCRFTGIKQGEIARVERKYNGGGTLHCKA